MNRYCILLILFFFSIHVISQEVIATQGEVSSNSASILNFTIGEVVTSFGTDGSNEITQGFQQVFFEITKVEDNQIEMDISVFPNPAIDQVTVQLSNYSTGLNYALYDSFGKQLLNSVFNSNEISIQFSNYSTGTYFLVVKAENEKLKTFKIQKSH